jgi:hypothetical protein
MSLPLIRGGKAQITVYLEPGILEKLDKKRGEQSRNGYVTKIIETAIA